MKASPKLIAVTIIVTLISLGLLIYLKVSASRVPSFPRTDIQTMYEEFVLSTFDYMNDAQLVDSPLYLSYKKEADRILKERENGGYQKVAEVSE